MREHDKITKITFASEVAMLFCTFEYMLFFPVVTVVFFLLPQIMKRYWLLAVSLFFYACWKPEYLALIIISILITYFSSRAIERLENRSKLILVACLVSNLAILFFFKYFNFVAATVNSLASHQYVPLLDVVLPVGISFYTFQAIGYTIDVYRKKLPAERNLITYATFVCYFPQLVAGPIERSENLLPQIRQLKRFDYDEFKSGLILIGWGFFMKLVIADRAAILVDGVFDNYESCSSLTLLLAAAIFSIQLYCDFAAYSQIAIGSAQIMGIRLMKNFKAPYFSGSISEFWSRWHISLSSWLQDYIFTPLVWSGWWNRLFYRKRADEKPPHFLANLIILFLVSGLWHGADWTFVIWGLIHGVYSAFGYATKAPRKKIRKKLHINENSGAYAAFKVVFIFVIVSFANIYFRADNMEMANGFIGRMFTAPFIDKMSQIFNWLDVKDVTVLALSVLILALVDKLSLKTDVRARLMSKPLAVQWVLYLLLIAAVAVFGIYGPAYDATPFIYFQF